MMSTPFLLGLTGSIGMGKSTTAKLFAEEGIPVWDADAVVEKLYSTRGEAVELVRAICPEAISESGTEVDRSDLRAAVGRDPMLLKKLEEAVHPLVAADRSAFIATAGNTGRDVVVLDIPLLFETGQEKALDAVAVVTAPADIQRKRVLGRGTLTESQYEVLLSRQKPDVEKRMLADFLIPTTTMEGARTAVRDILTAVRSREKID